VFHLLTGRRCRLGLCQLVRLFCQFSTNFGINCKINLTDSTSIAEASPASSSAGIGPVSRLVLLDHCGVFPNFLATYSCVNPFYFLISAIRFPTCLPVPILSPCLNAMLSFDGAKDLNDLFVQVIY